ncbi:MAG: hydroxymethylglutaryl-CoA lyase [Albidovulum sp.]
MTGFVEIVEMGPRDGLQNEPRLIPATDKIALVNSLSLVGFKRIEVASFVSPKWVPQMADGAQVLAAIRRNAAVIYSALTPNLKGYAAAMAAGADEVAIFASASEGFSRANLNCSISESLDRFGPVAKAAKADNVKMRGYVSMITDCPFEGAVAPKAVARVVAALRDLGCYEVSLGDTMGQGRPEAIDLMLDAVLNEMAPAGLAGHYHDTSGRALENIEVSLARGIRVFDASVAGLGGCPYAPGAKGNVATESVDLRLRALGYTTGLDHDALMAASKLAQRLRNPQSDQKS